jgi:hypothetical protein
METHFFTLQEFMTFTKGVAYLLMGCGLIGLPLYWIFLTGRDDEMRRF